MKATEQNREPGAVPARAATKASAKPPRPGGSRRSKHALNMETFVPAYLTFLAQKVSASASALYRPQFGVGITDWRIIALLAVEPWITPSRICDATGLDKGAVSRSVSGLIEAGLVEQQAESGTQRRLPLALTPKGLGVHDRVREACHRAPGAAFGRIFGGRARLADRFSGADAGAGGGARQGRWR